MEFKPLTNKDYLPFKTFLRKAYGGHILSYKPFLHWYFGGTPDAKKNYPYEAYIAINEKKEIVGLYGALPITTSIDQKLYSMCWMVNGMILPEYQRQGIGRMLVDCHLQTFDIIGVYMYTEAVIPLYKKKGFNLFQLNPMKRFIISLSEDSYKLVEYLGESPRKAKECSPLFTSKIDSNPNIKEFNHFTEDLKPIIQELEKSVKVTTHRSLLYLKWRFIDNPLTYRKFKHVVNGETKGYIVIREEQYHPLTIKGIRIIDLVGSQESAKELLNHVIAYAQKQEYACVECGYVGDLYDITLKEASFVELEGKTSTWWPMINNPMIPRENREWILLGSSKYPELVRSLKYTDLYFTRSESDRDRYNGGE